MATLSHIIVTHLAANPPVVRFVLRKPLGAKPPAAYEDMVRGGFLRIVAGISGREPGPAFDLTAKGKREIASGFFAGAKMHDDAGFLDVPVGQFRYLPASAVFLHHDLKRPDPDYRYVSSDIPIGLPEVIFKHNFEGNANAAALLRLGPAGDWTIDHYTRPHPTLNQLGRVGTQTLPLRRCHSEWAVREFPPYDRPHCSNA